MFSSLHATNSFSSLIATNPRESSPWDEDAFGFFFLCKEEETGVQMGEEGEIFRWNVDNGQKKEKKILSGGVSVSIENLGF